MTVPYGINDVQLNRAPSGRHCEYCGGANSGYHENCPGCGAPLMTREAIEDEEDGYCYEALEGDNAILKVMKYPCP